MSYKLHIAIYVDMLAGAELCRCGAVRITPTEKALGRIA